MCVLEGGSIYTIGDDFVEKANAAHYNKNKDRRGGPEELVQAGVYEDEQNVLTMATFATTNIAYNCLNNVGVSDY
jgi:hypothetical protein